MLTIGLTEAICDLEYPIAHTAATMAATTSSCFVVVLATLGAVADGTSATSALVDFYFVGSTR